MGAQQTNHHLGEPFSRIFTDRAEAEWAFDLMRETVKRLGLTDAYDPRFALTLPHRSGRQGLHLNFGGWLVLGFQGPGLTHHRVDMALLARRVAWDERFDSLPFARKEGEPEVRSYQLPFEMIRPLTSDLRAAYEATLDYIAAKFHAWKRSPIWKQHNPEIIEALFDPERRERLFAGGLAETELIYERYYTAFGHEISEESEDYEVDSTPFADKAQLGQDLEQAQTLSNYQLQRRSRVNLDQEQLEKKLITAFSQFRKDAQARFVVKLRRKRAEQLQALLSNPSTIDLATFNREVWVDQSATYFQGGNINLISDFFVKKTVTLEQIAELEQALETGKLELHGNYMWGTASRIYGPKLKDDDEQKTEYICQALNILNDSNLTPLQKAQQITRIYGFGNNIATGLVMVFHPTEFGLYNNQGIKILKNLGYGSVTTIEAYQKTLQSLKEIVKAEDFLELDWFLYIIDQGKYGAIESLQQDLQSGQEAKSDTSGLNELSSANYVYPLSQLAGETGFKEAELARWVRAIERKGQAILYGPPGTGKTFIAEKLAAHLTGGGDGFWELVQFHPAYAYEDFVQGIRPHSEGGALSYPLVPGHFLQFCQKAQARRNPCVLIIDEINRANLARVFGELMYLLEYRDREVPLAGGGRFKIPANVRLIGTMNTADRSIALVDHALRRRFAFIALYPNYDLLRHYHRQTGFPVEGLIDTLQSLNRHINDHHYAVGITFFLRPNLQAQLEDIWRMEIEPYLEEYFFDRQEDVDGFRWAAVKERVLP